MANTTFLQKTAAFILENYSEKITETLIILPNKRAKVFLIDALRQNASKTIFAPQIISIEEFVQDIAKIRTIDPVELMFEFYETYLEVTPKDNQQPFELFSNWGKTLVQDFNEIDRYLLDPNKVLSYLKDIEDIKHWSLDPEQRTPMIESYLRFWDLLPEYYRNLYQRLLQKKTAYQGIIYREAVAGISQFVASQKNTHFLFAGFNALNVAEEKIVQFLLENANAKVIWDADKTFLEDPFHDAGLFLRRFKRDWKFYRSQAFTWISDDFSQPKKISVIGTPKTIGQAKIAGEIVQQIIENNPDQLNKTAVVLGDENLLVPMLYSLPENVESLNITMGYSGKNNPAQLLISKLFKMHTNAISRGGNYVFYYKEILDVLTNPLVEPFANAGEVVNIIKENNFTFITQEKVKSLQTTNNTIFDLLLTKWDKPQEALQLLSELLITIKENLGINSDQDKLSRTFVYAIFKVIIRLQNCLKDNPHIDSVEGLHGIYKQIVDLAEVSFEGEPLNGLQIMGVLESRVLDFENVIITSTNEGKFPAGKSQNSFIPYDVKAELGLPTFKEKDAIYTYHFYHLLQRAKNIYLLYNTENEGLDGGEKSRFITQLEVEKMPNHQLSHEIYAAEVPDKAYEPWLVPKSESVMTRLAELANSGFSPSSITSYIRNPIQFYMQQILRIREAEEVEENIAVNTLGTIIHGTLEELYKPFLNQFISVENIKNCIAQIDEEVLRQFKKVYKEGEIKKGKNLLAFEVAKRNVFNFLKLEIELLEQGDAVKILALEQNFERILNHPKLPFPMKIKGNVDRIEQRNGKIRIIDYKTGKVEQKNVVLDTWENLTADIKTEKIIQVLAYAFLYEPHLNGMELEVGIISFKNLKAGFLPFVFKEEKLKTELINPEISANYIEELVKLLQEIFNPEIPFEEKV